MVWEDRPTQLSSDGCRSGVVYTSRADQIASQGDRMNPAETTGVVRLMSANSSTAEMAWVESEEDFTEEQPRDRVASSADKNDYCTIYLLRNTVSGKIYVGQTWLALNMRAGKRGEKYSNSIYLYASIQKHGWDRFEYEILTHCRTQVRADWLESYHMRKLDAQNPAVGYNLDDGGSCGKRSDETKAKISKSMKEKVWSPEAIEARKRGGQSCKGKKKRPRTPEQKKQERLRRERDGHPRDGFRKLTPDQEQGIVARYQAFETLKAIARSIGISAGLVSDTLKRFGVPKRRASRIQSQSIV